MNFSVNQVRQLYVVNALKSAFADLKTPGDAYVGSADSNIFLQYMGAIGDIMRSDTVKAVKIKYINAVSAEDMAYKLKGYKVTLDPTVNGGNPVAGQDYLLRFAFREFIGVSPSDQYFQYGQAHAYSGMTAVDLFKRIAVSAAINMQKEVNPLVHIYMYSAINGMIEVTSSVKVTDLDKYNDFQAVLYVMEAAQPWHLGTMAQGVIPFELQGVTITVDGEPRHWEVVENYQFVDAEDKPIVLPVGQKIADLEWFAMGERGDQYRLVGWPNVIPTKYMVDPKKDYDMITIHYFFTGDNEQAQKSEKDIQIACPVGDAGEHDVANAVIAALNTAIKQINPDWVDVKALA